TQVALTARVFNVALDQSRSRGAKATPAGATRREEALTHLADDERELDRFGREIEIVRVDFSKEPVVVESFSPETPGEQTAIGHLLDSIPKLAPGKKVVGVLLFSDRAQRALP